MVSHIKTLENSLRNYKSAAFGGGVMALIEKHNDDELFTKKKYEWTGTTSLGLKTIRPLKKLIK